MQNDAFSLCHPFVNMLFFVVVLGITMFVQHPVFLAISFISSFAYAIWLSGYRKVLKFNLIVTLPALLLVALLNPMFNHYGVTSLYYIESSGNEITLEALVYGLVLGCVMFIVIMWFSSYNQVMTSDKFIFLFGQVIPALSLILSMALRFVPRFGEQMEKIRNGQKCAGHDVTNGRLIDKLKYGLAMLSIMITWALENAIDTADSMKSRGYGLKGRTAYSVYRFDKRDKLLTLWMLFLLFVFGTAIKKGAAYANYDPRILFAGFTVMGHDCPVESPLWLVLCGQLCFACFCFTPFILGIYQNYSLKVAARKVGKDMAITYQKIFEEAEHEATKNIQMGQQTSCESGAGLKTASRINERHEKCKHLNDFAKDAYEWIFEGKEE